MLKFSRIYRSPDDAGGGGGIDPELFAMATADMDAWKAGEPMNGTLADPDYLPENEKTETPLPDTLVQPAPTPAPIAAPTAPVESAAAPADPNAETTPVEPVTTPAAESDPEKFYEFQGRTFSKADVASVFDGFAHHHGKAEAFAQEKAAFEQEKAALAQEKEQLANSEDNIILKFFKDDPEQMTALLDHIKENNPEIVDAHGRAGQSNAVTQLAKDLAETREELKALREGQTAREQQAQQQKVQQENDRFVADTLRWVNDYTAEVAGKIATEFGVVPESVIDPQDVQLLKHGVDFQIKSGTLKTKQDVQNAFRQGIDRLAGRARAFTKAEQTRHIEGKGRIPPAPPSIGGTPSPIVKVDLSNWNKIEDEAARQFDTIFNKITR